MSKHGQQSIYKLLIAELKASIAKKFGNLSIQKVLVCDISLHLATDRSYTTSKPMSNVTL